MITVVFMAFLILSMSVALVDWRRGWLLAVLCAVLQDPARKLTPGTPVAMTLSIILIYAVVLFGAQATLQRHLREFARRFATVKVTVALLFIFLFLAAVNGLATFGLENWKAPALALFIYCAPIPAVILGFAYLQSEEQMYSFFRFYAVITSVAMVGTVLEYLNVPWSALGTVALTDSLNMRFVTGFSIRMLSGFYRAPDIMGWHAATLTIIGIAMTLRSGPIRRSWPWLTVLAWGFLNCLISGRRKAVYMVAVFAVAFLLRYVRRLTTTQVTTFIIAGLALLMVVRKVGQDAEANVYTRGTETTTGEIVWRLEGGLIETVSQFGLMGAGLGTATQGVYHVVSSVAAEKQGWQEGGLGKLTMELGLPGLMAVIIFGISMLSVMMRISGHPDERGSSQFLRASLFAIVIANVVEFFVSAQAYSDAGLTLITAFFVGCLLATAVLSERQETTLGDAPALARPLPISVRV